VRSSDTESTAKWSEEVAGCSLSLGERVRVRGNRIRAGRLLNAIPGTIELYESSGEAGSFPRRS